MNVKIKRIEHCGAVINTSYVFGNVTISLLDTCDGSISAQPGQITFLLNCNSTMSAQSSSLRKLNEVII